MRDVLLGLGLALAIEGTLYALLPGPLRAFMRRADRLSDGTFRLFGLLALVLGVTMVWLARG